MKIYLISQDEEKCSSYRRHVIVANTRKQARSMARSTLMKTEDEIWDNACLEFLGHYRGDHTEPFILMSDFNEEK